MMQCAGYAGVGVPGELHHSGGRQRGNRLQRLIGY